MLIDQQKVAQRIKGSPHGCNATFVPLDEKWGVKLFQNSKERDRVYEIQKKFSAHNLAPDLGEKVDIQGIAGYVTEIIEPIIPWELILIEDGSEYVDAVENAGIFFDEEIADERISEMKEIVGIYLCDMHEGNWGTKNGELIPLDFGSYFDEKGNFYH